MSQIPCRTQIWTGKHSASCFALPCPRVWTTVLLKVKFLRDFWSRFPCNIPSLSPSVISLMMKPRFSPDAATTTMFQCRDSVKGDMISPKLVQKESLNPQSISSPGQAHALLGFLVVSSHTSYMLLTELQKFSCVSPSAWHCRPRHPTSHPWILTFSNLTFNFLRPLVSLLAHSIPSDWTFPSLPHGSSEVALRSTSLLRQYLFFYSVLDRFLIFFTLLTDQ